MVESLKELNSKCQKENYRTVGNWMVRYILRPAAIPITWALLHTNITANQVTLISLALGLMGIALFASVTPGWFLLGTVLLQLWYLLDHVDGQIARYRGTASLTGRFFDFLTHHIIHTPIFFALGVCLFRQTHSFFILVWGFILSMLILSFNLIHDARSKAFIEKMLREKVIRVRLNLSSNDEIGTASQSWVRSAFSVLHKACEIHVLMNVLTGVALLTFVFQAVDLRGLVFFFYSISVPVLAVTKLVYVIVNQKCDTEYESQFTAE
jgi:hypothetical protein